MTTPSTPRKAGPLLGTGAQTSWPFTFKVFAASDIAVTIANNLGVETALVLNADYSVTLNSNQDTSPGGTVTYPISGSALPTGSKLTIFGNLPYDQPLDLPSGGNFSPLALENQLDRLTMQIQQLRENVGRALQVSVTTNADATLPPPTASQLIGWDSTGENLENVPLSELATAIAYGTYRYDTFTGDGTTTNFALSEDPAVLANLDVSISGVVQVPGTDYSLLTGNLVFASAPSNGTTILARYGQALTALPDSDQITFVQAGSGAVTRTVQNKLREWASVKDFGATGDGSTDDADAIEAADTYADTNRVPVYFPPGAYRVKRTITRVSQSAWFGPSQQSNANINNEVQIFGTVGDIGDGNPMIRCAATGVTISVSSLSFENLEFVSDKSVDFADLSTTTSNGITLVDVSNVKNGLEFTGCSFKNAAFGIRQSDGDPYLDKVTLDRCHFTLLYKAIQCNPTAGLSLANCFVYDCFDWVYTKGISGTRANGADVFLNACSFNNSSFAAEYTSITAATIVATTCWFEGGNHWLHATKFAKAEGCYFSEAYSADSNTKFSMAPNDPDVSSCAFMSIGNRIATNTRLIDLGDVTDKTTISVTCIANYDGSNFSESAAIGTQLTNGIDYEGYANVNTSTWNVSQHNRKIAIGTKRNPEQQIDVQNNGGGTGVFQRITDTASSLPMAGFIFERSQAGSNDFRAAANTVGEFEIASATDGVTWTARARVGTSWQWEPGADNTQKLGSASFRWSEVFAGNGTINTSDANLKQQVRDLSDAEKAVALAIKGQIKAYKFNDAVAAKGDAARVHFGVIAQDVAAAFAAHGLDANHYGVFCKDTVWKKDEQIVSADEFGNLPEGAVSEDRLGVRYDELFAFILASI